MVVVIVIVVIVIVIVIVIVVIVMIVEIPIIGSGWTIRKGKPKAPRGLLIWERGPLHQGVRTIR